MDEGHVADRRFVPAGRHTTPIFQRQKEILDRMTFGVKRHVVRYLHRPIAFRRNADGDAPICHCGLNFIRAISAVGSDRFYTQLLNERNKLFAVGTLAWC